MCIICCISPEKLQGLVESDDLEGSNGQGLDQKDQSVQVIYLRCKCPKCFNILSLDEIEQCQQAKLLPSQYRCERCRF